MAVYKNSAYLRTSDSAAFDALHHPGANTDNSCIYRCEGCGHEIASNKGSNPLPPQNHHQHGTGAAIHWRLMVYAETR